MCFHHSLHKKGFTGQDIAASKISPINHLSTIKNFKVRGSVCCEEGFRASKKVQQASGPSPKVYSAAGLGHHQCRACSGMAAGRRDKDWTPEDWGKVIFSDESPSLLFGASRKSLSGEDKVSATISPVSCQQ
ncbi:hypothetical protein FQN60_009697 [Etheostoma spectabile]|uniref:Uncharacterized protein n=1 Tax=Etheostoma spectabile TaxID=54343 RepID=A0A5J5DJX5_9PERO|nr:hypothetical protein FQN60_009697 [Etheostoma spectabile]